VTAGVGHSRGRAPRRVRGPSSSWQSGRVRSINDSEEAGEAAMAKRATNADGNDATQPGKLKRKKYEKELRKLQAELCKLQDWV